MWPGNIVIFSSILLGLCVIVLVVMQEIRRKHVAIWLGSYLVRRLRVSFSDKAARKESPTHVVFCVVDHFEPISDGSTREVERTRMWDWINRYPVLASRHRDSDGIPPQHTWFYPGENYDCEYLDDLARLSQAGFGEIELHLHHGFDSGETLRGKIVSSVEKFAQHGALVSDDAPPRSRYAFIHGNMAFDNSRNDPSVCGVNNEITILKETGCFADFSLPTAPCVSQVRMVNTVYYAIDDPVRPKSHDVGNEVEVGKAPSGDLMIIPGPLGLDWRNRKWGLIPRIENAEIQVSSPPTLSRVRNWVRQHIHVKGRPEWVFVKVSCHGAEDRSRDCLLGDIADQMYTDLETHYRDNSGYRLHYVTARELYNIVKAAEAGLTGDPSHYRDYLIPRCQVHSRGESTTLTTVLSELR